MIIDVHAHYVSPELVAALKRDSRPYGVVIRADEKGERFVFAERFTTRPIMARMIDVVEERLRFLDERGIDQQVICTWMDITGYLLPVEQGARLSRLNNETLAADVARYADRLIPMGTVPMQDGPAAAAELEYLVRQLGMPAIQIGTNVDGRNLDDPGLEPFWARAEELDVLVMLHPFHVAGAERMTKYYLDNLVGNPTDTTLAAASIIFGGVLERHPGLKLLFVHAGGFLPYQIGRFDRGFENRPECQTIPKPPSEYFKRLAFDAIAFRVESLEHLLRVAGSDKVLLGTDYPFWMSDPNALARVRKVGTIGEAELEAVLGGNALRLLKLVRV